MATFVFYRASDGEILGVVLQTVTPTGTYIETEVDNVSPLTHYVQAGVLATYTAEQLAAKASRPSAQSSWDNGTMAWEDTRTLADCKLEANERILGARDAAEFGGFTWNDGATTHTFDSNPISQARITGAVVMAMIAAQASQSFSIDWTLADGTVITLDGADMTAVGLALGTHVSTQHGIGRGLFSDIEAAATIAEVDAIVWP